MRSRLPYVIPLLLSTLLGGLGCDKMPWASKPRPHRAAAHAPSAAPSASSSAHAVGPDTIDRFALPFAWERAEDEPLARTRRYVREVFHDNDEYMKNGPRFFEAFAKAQRPRATVLTCSDSRVQSPAWDNTPENDDFMVRNIGNQLASSMGSVEYGVSDLSTPVLLILGHTGCGAVKAAMAAEPGHHSQSVQAELATLKLPEHLQGRDSESAWADAVVANVHFQVKAALSRFSPLVGEGRLTVIGAVYDFRDDLHKGAGRITLVDVNGNSEPKRLEAFTTAILNGASLAPAADGKGPSIPLKGGAGPGGMSASEAADLAAIMDAVRKIPGAEAR